MANIMQEVQGWKGEQSQDSEDDPLFEGGAYTLLSLVLQHRPHQCQSFICCQGPDLTFTKWQENSQLEAASIYIGHPRS